MRKIASSRYEMLAACCFLVMLSSVRGNNFHAPPGKAELPVVFLSIRAGRWYPLRKKYKRSVFPVLIFRQDHSLPCQRGTLRHLHAVRPFYVFGRDGSVDHPPHLVGLICYSSISSTEGRITLILIQCGRLSPSPQNEKEPGAVCLPLA